jgi:predicted metalloenzyme YecM
MSHRGRKTMSDINAILPGLDKFLDVVFSELLTRRIPKWEFEGIDHICYRVEKEARYKEMQAALGTVGTLALESNVANRNVSLYRLSVPIDYLWFRISIVELPAPKDGSFYAEGLEHVDLTVATPLEDFVKKHHQQAFDLKGIAKPGHAEISLELGMANVKFSVESIEREIERRI